MDPILCELMETLPCRTSQFEQLYNLFAYKDEVFVDNVYVYGGPSVGKSAVVTSLLKKLEINYAVINLIECYTSKILFETILNKLSGHRIDPNRGQPYAKCDNMMDFLYNIKKCSENDVDLNGSILILDKAEQLRSMDFNLLPAFLRLRELSGISISVIFLSEIVFEKYYAKTNIVEPLKIYFPQYNKDELLNILLLDVGNAHQMIINNFNEAIQFDVDFYRNYLNVFLSVFYRACRDLSELRHMAALNFLKYCEPIINKKLSMGDSYALWNHISPVLKASLEVLYLRVSTEQTIKTNTTEQHQQKLNILQQTNFMSVTKEKFLAQSLELPFYAKYLLIAAYLASYNSAKEDKRFFMKYHGKKRKTMKDVKAKSKLPEQLNTRLGPKVFTFDRLLAIFYSILDDKVGFNNNLLAQISSLVELQLLTTENCSLDGQKYKCNVNFDFIQSVSNMVGFNIRHYLSDFCMYS